MPVSNELSLADEECGQKGIMTRHPASIINGLVIDPFRKYVTENEKPDLCNEGVS